MAYIPDATQVSQPADTQDRSTAALEFRTLKSWIATNYQSMLTTLTALGVTVTNNYNTLVAALALKATINSPTFTGTVGGITKSMVGLGNVDNTSDAGKPVSTAQQTALDLKANLISPVLVTPALGTPSSGNLANCTFPTLNQNTSGSSASCTGNSATATSAAAVTGATGAKGWGYVADTGAVLASYNVTSVTRTATGTYRVVLATSMGSTNYAVVATLSGTAGSIVVVQFNATTFDVYITTTPVAGASLNSFFNFLVFA